MSLSPFSFQYKDEFLDREESNFSVLQEKIDFFFKATRYEAGKTHKSRRNLNHKFHYEQELENTFLNQKGVSSQELSVEINDMLQGVIRHQDPTTAFNMIPTPLMDVVAGLTILNMYNPNTCWYFISGKLCLYEKKIARMLGSLVGWDESDGFVITGGKQALLYAVKNGMNRVKSKFPVEMGDYVVLCSEVAHYSIEHVCHYLGISKENCIRVPANDKGEMNVVDLEKIIKKVANEDKHIAAVFAVGGATVNFHPDSIFDIKTCLDKCSQDLQLEYVPYLHVDTVISWTWLNFLGCDKTAYQKMPPKVAEKIQSVLNNLQWISVADSFAADFHKTGFCPYSAGFFVTKDASRLHGMYSDEDEISNMEQFSEGEIFKQTLENSRSGQAIMAIWIAMRKMGSQGFRDFITYQLTVSETFKKHISVNFTDHFEVVNDHSEGWELVLKPKFINEAMTWEELQIADDKAARLYEMACQQLIKEIWYKPIDSNDTEYPVIGFVKCYSRKGRHEKSFPAILIHPTSLHYNDLAVNELLEGILKAKTKIDEQILTDNLSMCEQLNSLTPPR